MNLTDKERERVGDWLDNPDLFPREFLTWCIDHAALSLPLLPVQQITGYTRSRADHGVVATAESTTEAGYVNLATEGPTLQGLANGSYLLILGAEFGKVGDPGTGAGHMSYSINNGAASDTTSVFVETGGTVVYHGVRAVRATLAGTGTSENNNEVKAKYRRDGVSSAGANPQFQNRFLIAIRAA